MSDMRLPLVYPPACRWNTADGRCGNPVGRPYPCGFRCAKHTPAVLAGHPEPTTPAQQQKEGAE